VEQRKTRRFSLQLPVAVVRAGTQRLAEAGLTRNISSHGVLFTAQRELDVGGAIEFVITLIDETQNPVNLRCIGTVVRHEKLDSGGEEIKPFVVAATLERYEFVRSLPGK
jgi:hypothetical protein